MMNMKQVRLNQNPILTNLLLGCGRGDYIAESLLPRLPQELRGMTIGKVGNESRKRHDLRRAPGTNTKRINIKYEGVVYTVDQYSVEVPIPREWFEEQAAAEKINIRAALKPSNIAIQTANELLLMNYEIEVADLVTNPATYGGNVLALAAGTKWSAATGTPVTDIAAAKNIIRKKVGKRPNKLHCSADAYEALENNQQVRSQLGSNFSGSVSKSDLMRVLNVAEIEIGDAMWSDDLGNNTDVWGNNAILSYSPDIAKKELSLAEPAFGFTSTLPGHPYAEEPYLDKPAKSWIYGATFERKPNLGMAGAGFLFQNCK